MARSSIRPLVLDLCSRDTRLPCRCRFRRSEAWLPCALLFFVSLSSSFLGFCSHHIVYFACFFLPSQARWFVSYDYAYEGGGEGEKPLRRQHFNRIGVLFHVSWEDRIPTLGGSVVVLANSRQEARYHLSFSPHNWHLPTSVSFFSRFTSHTTKRRRRQRDEPHVGGMGRSQPGGDMGLVCVPYQNRAANFFLFRGERKPSWPSTATFGFQR